MKEHIADRAMRPLRGLFIALLWVSVPGSLISLAMMLRLAFDAWPHWAFGLSCASVLIATLGVASLSDNRLEARNRRQDLQ